MRFERVLSHEEIRLILPKFEPFGVCETMLDTYSVCYHMSPLHFFAFAIHSPVKWTWAPGWLQGAPGSQHKVTCLRCLMESLRMMPAFTNASITVAAMPSRSLRRSGG